MPRVSKGSMEEGGRTLFAIKCSRITASEDRQLGGAESSGGLVCGRPREGHGRLDVGQSRLAAERSSARR